MLPQNHVIVGRYCVETCVGSGGMGAVYRARDLRLGKSWAIKVLTLTGSDAARHFVQEARLLANLEHPRLPNVSDHGTAQNDAFQFLVMQYIDGDDLDTLLEKRKEPFELEHVLRWADQLLDVVIYLHTRTPRVIHRDITPRNLKINNHGDIILLDFGIARALDEGLERSGTVESGLPTPLAAPQPEAGHERRQPLPGLKMGSSHFAPPEQLYGQTTDIQADLYAVSATLYTLLTRQPPADARARITAIRAGAADPLLAIRELNPAVPALLESLLEQGLSLHPNGRFSSAEAMRLALRRVSPRGSRGGRARARALNARLQRRVGLVRSWADTVRTHWLNMVQPLLVIEPASHSAPILVYIMPFLTVILLLTLSILL